MQRILLAILVYLMTSQIVITNCYSVEPDEFLQNPKKELRARNISKNVRCLVCQNQSIDESSAPLAKDLRILIRKKVKQGNSDDEIYDFLTERYGDFILLNPPFKISTLFLWILPFFFLAVGIFVIFLHNNKSKKLDYNK
jgi:cytochrome c-type biogenesis protein CcmH